MANENSVQTGQSLEEALLAEEQEIADAPDESPADRDIQAFPGFGGAGVSPAKLDGEDYANLE